MRLITELTELLSKVSKHVKVLLGDCLYNKNSSGDEIANVNFFTTTSHNTSKSPGTISIKFSVHVNGWPRYQMP